MSLSRVISSSAPKGSSMSSTRGRQTRARAIDTPLAHASRELVGKRRLPAREADEGEQLVRLRVLLHGFVPPSDLERQAHVVDGAPPGKEGRVLEHEGEVTGEPRLLRGAAEHRDLAFARGNEVGDRPEEGGLAAPRRAEPW